MELAKKTIDRRKYELNSDDSHYFTTIADYLYNVSGAGDKNNRALELTRLALKKLERPGIHSSDFPVIVRDTSNLDPGTSRTTVYVEETPGSICRVTFYETQGGRNIAVSVYDCSDSALKQDFSDMVSMESDVPVGSTLRLEINEAAQIVISEESKPLFHMEGGSQVEEKIEKPAPIIRKKGLAEIIKEKSAERHSTALKVVHKVLEDESFITASSGIGMLPKVREEIQVAITQIVSIGSASKALNLVSFNSPIGSNNFVTQWNFPQSKYQMYFTENREKEDVLCEIKDGDIVVLSFRVDLQRKNGRMVMENFVIKTLSEKPVDAKTISTERDVRAEEIRKLQSIAIKLRKIELELRKVEGRDPEFMTNIFKISTLISDFSSRLFEKEERHKIRLSSSTQYEVISTYVGNVEGQTLVVDIVEKRLPQGEGYEDTVTLRLRVPDEKTILFETTITISLETTDMLRMAGG